MQESGNTSADVNGGNGARSRRLWVPVVLVSGAIIACYSVCELLEWSLRDHPGSAATIRLLHVLCGTGTMFLVAALGGWIVFRRQPSPFQSPKQPFLLLATMPDEAGNLRNYCMWFIGLRWIAVFGALALSVALHCILKILPLGAFIPVLACLATLAVFNAVLAGITPASKRPYELLILQAVVDLVLLTALLQFSGGLENPLFALYVLHVIIGSILLKRTHALRVLALSCGLLLLVALLQMAAPGLHRHIPIIVSDAPHTLLFSLGIAVPYAFILVATAYILSMVKEQLNRTAEERREAYEQLIRQEKMVVLGEVAAGVAHEINNPLHGVQSALAMCKKDGCGINGTCELVPLMEEGLDRIALITRRLVLHSRREALPMRETDVNEVIADSVKFIEYRARQQGASLIQRLDPMIPTIAADAKALSEVFINLLVNALDALEKGRGTIEVETRREKEHVEVAISDTGCGIPPENIEQIFHPFFTTKPVGKGSGLGLSISKKIVEDHQGTIRVESRVGEGSRFIMAFPALDAAATRQEPTRRSVLS